MQHPLFSIAFLATLASGYWLPETVNKEQFKTCVVPKSTGDDSPTIISTVKSCGSNSRVVFSAGTEYSLLTPLTFSGLTNVEFLINGNLTLSDDPAAVAAVVHNPSVYTGHWIKVSKSTGVTFTASTLQGGGWINGHGDKWWSAANVSSNTGRPHLFSFAVTGLRLRGLRILNPVAWCFSLAGSDVFMTDTVLDASQKTANAFPFNTDGIDVGGSNIVIDGWYSVNGDDVINISPPAVNVTMRNIVAYGTHGISVSCAVGTGSGYLFENAVIHDSVFGARFKGSVGTTCQISNVTWSNITITETSYPIHFIEDYVDQEKGAAGKNLSLAAYAKNFRWENIKAQTGKSLKDGSCTSNPCWSHTIGESTEKGLYLICKDAAHCQNFTFKDITLTGADGRPGQMECVGLEGDTTLGIPCTNGTLTGGK
ncbi:exo-polygalacturonase [Colletotrichum orchidophilum]|uniref:Exo-polygalacturonase n=1 Tax=Colletotrichum orchidophilum TaxID=1209926 RepID=A0A1G4B8B1_9PEZI|nr:exo-polygalacturonase [Colletotrichum orchidophilum]OHE97698.1 exo-polygalacturonase [Colletotrichum orchidophilum]